MYSDVTSALEGTAVISMGLSVAGCWGQVYLLQTLFLLCSKPTLQQEDWYLRVEAGIMRRVVLWDTACNFNAFISNQSIFNCLITGESTLITIGKDFCH